MGCSNENPGEWDRRREKAIASWKDYPSPDYMQLSSMIIYISEIAGSVSKQKKIGGEEANIETQTKNPVARK